MDHPHPRKGCAGANEAPRGPGSTAAPPLKGTVGGGGPPTSPIGPRTSQEATRGRRPPPLLLSNSSGCGGAPPATCKSLCGCPPRGHARSPPTPLPPPEALTQCGAACHLKISVWVWDQAARATSFNRRPPPQWRAVSVVGGPPQPNDRMVVMAPREPSIVPTPTGPQEPRSGVTRRERVPLHACLSHMSDPVPRGPQ